MFTQQDHEQLYEDLIRTKQQVQDLKEDTTRLKTKIKLQEADLLRKDKALEDFQQQSLFI